MKKIFCIFIAFLLLSLSSCTDADPTSDTSNTTPTSDTSSSKKSQTPSGVAKDYMSQILNCFKNDDKDSLKELMSDYIIENDTELDNEIEAALDFIDGKIVSYDDPFGDAMGSHEKKACGGSVWSIITEHGTEYSLSFTGWVTYDADESRIGVEGIRVVNVTERSKYPVEANKDIPPGCLLKIGHFE